MIAMTATAGIRKPPRSSLSSLVPALLRAATESEAADDCAKTGVLAMESARIAATDAFFKLILNSLLSFSLSAVPQWYRVDNPKMRPASSLSEGCCAIARVTFAEPKDSSCGFETHGADGLPICAVDADSRSAE